ncbi:diacylglycerol acyltransferase-domain-containing protein [Hypoxylon sp. FL0890]|nr:diacylglycerol acyltransferase-domain-containing protein [Hypoxylon sp. FL0890]
MTDENNGSPRRQELSNSSRGSKLPRLGHRHHRHEIEEADYESKSGARTNIPSKKPAHDIKSTPTKEHKREFSSSSSIASQGSSDLPIPRTPPRSSRTAIGKPRKPRTSSDNNSQSFLRDNRISSHQDSISAVRVVLPYPITPSQIPRALASKTSLPHQVFRRKDPRPKDAPNMESLPGDEKSAREWPSLKEMPEAQKSNGEAEPQAQNGDGSAKANHGSARLDRSAISTEASFATPVNGLKSTADEDKTDGASYASALKTSLDDQDTDDSPTRRGPNAPDDDDSYPELDDMTVDEIHHPPKPSPNGGIRWAPWNVPLKRRLQTLVVLMHCMCIALTVSIFFALSANPFVWPLLLIYLLHVLSSKAATDGSLKYRSEWFRRSYMWRLFANYFPAKLHKTHNLPPTRKYIFGYHPHGIISHGAWAAFATEALGFSEKFPGITNSLLTLDSNFRIPLYREYILAAGVRSVSKESIVNILTRGGPNGEGMGRAVTIVIGGARESLEAQPGTMRLILKERKGFVKIAVRTGADLVPVLAFGENDLYDQLHPKEHPLVHKLQMFILKVWKFTLPFLHGRGIFNYDVGLMPYRRPLNVVVGAPIKVTQANTVDQEEINRLHDLYVTELQKLWDRYKDEFAPDRKDEMQILS